MVIVVYFFWNNVLVIVVILVVGGLLLCEVVGDGFGLKFGMLVGNMVIVLLFVSVLW